MKEVNVKGIPDNEAVEAAKRVMEEGELDLLVRVDTLAAACRIKDLADGLGYAAAISGGEGNFLLLLDGEDATPVLEKVANQKEIGPVEGWALVLTQEGLGGGDELGMKLMRDYLAALTKSVDKPDLVVLLHNGVKLFVTSQELAALVDSGAKLLVSAESLATAGLTGKQGLGTAVDMEDIVQEMGRRSKVVTL